jgi:HAD superfamily hydrolase (TIGR01549 family)
MNGWCPNKLSASILVCILGENFVEKKKLQLIFDFDGTLLSSLECILSSLKILLEEIFERPYTPEEVRAGYCADMAKVAERFGLDVSTPEKQMRIFSRWCDLSDRELDQLSLYDGAEDFLMKLRDKGYESYLWTARDHKTTWALLNRYKLDKYFLGVHTADDPHPKPSVQGLNEMIKDGSGDYILIGDSEADALGAQKIEVPFFHAAWDKNHPPVEESLVFKQCEKLEDLWPFIEGHQRK